MKAICINGSARSNGSTEYIVDKVIEGMKENSIETRKHCLGNLNINYCCGNKKCYETGKCVKKDDVQMIISDIAESDIVVIATPDYWGDITGQLKVFFDRTTPYGDTNENRKLTMSQNKVGIAISIRAGKTERENIHILESIEHYFGHLSIKPIARLGIRETDSLEELLEKHQQEINEAYELGKSVHKYVEENKKEKKCLN